MFPFLYSDPDRKSEKFLDPGQKYKATLRQLVVKLTVSKTILGRYIRQCSALSLFFNATLGKNNEKNTSIFSRNDLQLVCRRD